MMDAPALPRYRFLLKPRYEPATTIRLGEVSERTMVGLAPPTYPNDTINGYNLEVLSCLTLRPYRS
jgi:hypothetical protein